tara:strand:+ start:350 stop:880 length:531 start_codon:yes stop_codon:yes gene_type:complete
MKSKLLKLTLTIVIYFLSLGFSYSNENQSKFISIIDEYKNKYSPNSNELKTNKLLIDRDNKLCNEISLSVNNWIGKIKSIDTNMEGKGILAVIIDKGIFIETWNNAFSDLMDNTLIEVDSKVYNQLMEFNNNQQIKFSGSFISNSNGCFRLKNLSKKSKLIKPSFTFKFSDAKRID